nr:Tn3 family transposase [Salmonella enterica]
MAESSPGLTYAKLSPLQARHIRDETYSAALAELVNHQYRHAFAAHWGDGTTHPPMASASARVAGARAPGTSTRSTVASRDGCSIPISPTSTRRSAPAW